MKSKLKYLFNKMIKNRLNSFDECVAKLGMIRRHSSCATFYLSALRIAKNLENDINELELCLKQHQQEGHLYRENENILDAYSKREGDIRLRLYILRKLYR